MSHQQEKIDSFLFDELIHTSGLLSLYAGELKIAEIVANDLISRSGYRFPTGVNGDALHDGYQLLGMINLRRGEYLQAENCLIRSLDHFSPVTKSFGPRMRLANQLLEKQRFNVVEKYFLRCKEGWRSAEKRQIDRWILAVRSGKSPSGRDWEDQLGYL